MSSGRLPENSEEVVRKSHSLFLSLALIAFATSVEAVTTVAPKLGPAPARSERER